MADICKEIPVTANLALFTMYLSDCVLTYISPVYEPYFDILVLLRLVLSRFTCQVIKDLNDLNDQGALRFS